MGRDNLFAVLSQECMNRLKTIIFSPCGGHTVKKALFVGSNRKFEISSPIPDHSHRSCWKSSEINEDSPIISDQMHGSKRVFLGVLS